MFEWITRLCSSDNSSPFQSALNYCTYADWSVPNEQKMIYIIQCFSGNHNDIIRAQKAFLQFKTKFEQHQDKNNMAFRLKNLLILDRCTQQMCILDTIAHYQYNRLFYERNKLQTVLQSQSLQQFISAYYLYIKKKSNIYVEFPTELFGRQSRKKYISSLNNFSKIFQCIDKSIQIQKLINQTNDTLKKVNKSPQLIQQILNYFLKTYIFVYSIVAMCLHSLLSKIKLLKNTQLTNLEKLLKYFRKDFTNNFLRFLQSNKTINAFKNFQYNQILKIDQVYITSFEQYYRLKLEEQNTSNQILQNPHIDDQKNKMNRILANEFMNQNVLQLPDQAFKNLNIQMKFSFLPRKTQIVNRQRNAIDNQFKKYQNYYHEDFIDDENLKQIQNKNHSNDTVSTLSQLSNSQIIKKNDNKTKNIPQSNLNQKSQINLNKSRIRQLNKYNKFNRQLWQNWQNIYSLTKKEDE